VPKSEELIREPGAAPGADFTHRSGSVEKVRRTLCPKREWVTEPEVHTCTKRATDKPSTLGQSPIAWLRGKETREEGIGFT
jgi:hypothetical protein